MSLRASKVFCYFLTPIRIIGLFIITVSFHLFLCMAFLSASAHVLNPISHLTLSTVLPQVSLGRPLFLFPSGAHVSAVPGNESGFVFNACSVHLHLHVFICVHNILSDLVLPLTSSFIAFLKGPIFFYSQGLRIVCLCRRRSLLSIFMPRGLAHDTGVHYGIALSLILETA